MIVKELIDKIVKFGVKDELSPAETVFLLKSLSKYIDEHDSIDNNEKTKGQGQLLNEAQELNDCQPYLDSPKGVN